MVQADAEQPNWLTQVHYKADAEQPKMRSNLIKWLK
jgi:hypothetical protein